jgi:microcystin-dependent protein
MDFLIGSIVLFPYSFVPMGWLPCNGSTVSVSEYQTLFALIGTRYGGDGINNFKLPDLGAAKPNDNISYFIACEGEYPQRS